jgi:hypothetical protein
VFKWACTVFQDARRLERGMRLKGKSQALAVLSMDTFFFFPLRRLSTTTTEVSVRPPCGVWLL